MMIAGDHVMAFDEAEWIAAGRPEDKAPFRRQATILEIDSDQATITWDHGDPKNTRINHRVEDLKEVRVPDAS